MGRERELAAVRDAVTRPRRTAHVVEIRGEPGIGKSRLASEAVACARAQGHPALHARASPPLRRRPYGFLAELTEDCLDALDGDAAAAADLRDRTHRPADMARAARRVLVRLAGREALVLCLDDLQWADAASGALLAHLVRHPPRGPVLFVVAHRPAQTPDGLLTALACAHQAGTAQVIEPAPLAAPDADRLLAGTATHLRGPGAALAAGNPLHLHAVAELLRGPSPDALDGVGGGTAAAGRLSPSGGGEPGVVPNARRLSPAIRATLLADLETVSPRARVVAGAAALAGACFTARELHLATELPDADVLAAVDELCAVDLVRPAGTRLTFRHPLLRCAVEQRLPLGQARAVHRRLLDGADAHATPLGDRARHAFHVETGHADLLRDAGRAVALVHPAEAAAYLEAALRRPAPGDPAHAGCPLVAVELAEALLRAGRPARAEAVARDCAVPTVAARTATIRAAACAARGEHARAARLLAVPSDDRPHTLLRLQLAVTAGPLDAGDEERARALAGAGPQERRRTLADAAGEEPERPPADAGDAATHAAGQASALAVLCLHAIQRGNLAAAEACADAAEQAGDDLDDDALALQLDGPAQLGWCLLLLDRAEAAARVLHRQATVARARRRWGALPHLLAALAHAETRTGAFADAEAAAEEAISLAGAVLADGALALALTERVRGRGSRGDTDGALSAARRAAALDHRVEPLLRGAVTLTVAEAQLAAARPAAALATLAPLVRARRSGRTRPWAAAVHELRTRAELAAGDPRAAERAAQAAERAAVAWPLPSHRGLAALAAAQAAAGDDDARAAELAATAARRLARGALRPAEALAHAVAATAAARLEAGGAARWHRRSAAAIARTAGAPSLSVRERQVATMVSQGLGNKQIAQALTVSPRTVETYMERLFAKLDVTSRAGVAAAIVRAQSAAPAPDRARAPEARARGAPA